MAEMRFIILMSADPSWDGLSESDQSRIIEEHEIFEADLKARGSYISSARFGPDPGRAVVQSSTGHRSTTSGPAPGEGAIGGYYLIETDTMDEALAWASRCRFITGTNWVYPVWD